MDQELLKVAAQMGAPGLLAFGMFLFYRRDALASLDAERNRTNILVQVVEANTKVVAQLSEKLDRVLEDRSR